tara:strand:- start:185 stop:385 length:201 start_codon:yes stop_codon:yes gene_type:complete
MQHPIYICVTEVEALLTMAATERKAPAAARNQALSAALLLYRELRPIGLPWLNRIEGRHIPNACHP